MNTNEDFTRLTSNWLNTFINDLAGDKQKVLKRLEDFPGDQGTVKKAIEEGPDVFDKKDTNTCRTLFNFVEFYATGKISSIAVGVVDA